MTTFLSVTALAAEPVSATEAIEAFRSVVDAVPAVGFAYMPGRCPWFRVTDGGAIGADGKAVALAAAYEVTAFTGGSQLRWRRRDEPTAPALLLRDGDRPSGTLADEGATLWKKHPYPRLLWGKVRRVADGWATVGEHRVQEFGVPLPAALVAQTARGDRLTLLAYEYVAEDRHGNVRVVDERLAGIDLATSDTLPRS